MLKKILILIGLLGILLPAVALAATNIVSVTPDGQNVTIKVDNVSEGTDPDKDIVIINPSGQRVSMTLTVKDGVATITNKNPENPGPPSTYTYTVSIKGAAPESYPVTTTATPPVTPPAEHTILPVGKNPAEWTLDDIEALIANIGNLMLSIAGGVAIVYIIIGAYHYFFAFGSEEQATTAKKTITWAIVGLVVIILSKVLLTTVWNFMATDANPINFFF